jgi:holliday junction DNA helicase RuvA
MRDKLSQLLPASPSDFGITVASDPKAQAIQDAMSALVNLGYNQITAQKAIKKTLGELSDQVDLPTLITSALKNI